MQMSSIIAIAMLASASAQWNPDTPIHIGTPCDCTVSASMYSHFSASGATPHNFSELEGCEGESDDVMDVWNGLGVEFLGYERAWTDVNETSDVDETFEYTVECALPCLITRVDLEGNGWCSNDADGSIGTVLQLWGSNADLTENQVLGQSVPDLGSGDSSSHGVVSIIPAPYELKTRFTINEICPGTEDTSASEQWKCRNSLSIMATTSMDKPPVCAGACQFTDSESGESSGVDSSDDPKKPPMHCYSDKECPKSQICDVHMFCVEPSTDSSAASGEITTTSAGWTSSTSSGDISEAHIPNYLKDGFLEALIREFVNEPFAPGWAHVGEWYASEPEGLTDDIIQLFDSLVTSIPAGKSGNAAQKIENIAVSWDRDYDSIALSAAGPIEESDYWSPDGEDNSSEVGDSDSGDSSDDSSDESSSDSSEDSSDESSSDSSEVSSSDSSDDSSSNLGVDSSHDSSERPARCQSNKDCRDGQVCAQDVFVCVEASRHLSSSSSSDDSSDDSSANSDDDSSDDSGRSKRAPSSPHHPPTKSEYKQVFLELSVDEIPDGWRLMTAAEADSRRNELVASMGTWDIIKLDGGEIRGSGYGGKVEHWADPNHQTLGHVFIVPAVGPLSQSSTSMFGDFDVEQPLIVCLVLMNVVLLFYVCPCKSNLAKNKQVYGHVRRSEQEDLCA